MHKQILKIGRESDLYLGGNLVRLYASHGKMVEARDAFTKLRKQNTYSWATLIRGYVETGEARVALMLFNQMMKQGQRACAVLFVYLLKACASLRDLSEGKGIHFHIVKHGLGSNLYVGSALVDMYTKCSSMKTAREVFDSLTEKDVVTWTAIISGYVSHGSWEEAITLYDQMQKDKVNPNQVTFACALRACAGASALATGRRVHTQIVRLGVVTDFTLQNCLLDMYVKCGSMEEAQQLFEGMTRRDVVSWNAMVSGSLKCGCGLRSIQLYKRMLEEGVEPDETTFACVAKACATVSAQEDGKQVHFDIVLRGLESNVMVGTALLDMHLKCGNIEVAQHIFSRLPNKDVVSWNAMMSGCVRHGQAKMAVKIYEQMQHNLVEAGEDTFACVLKACADLHLLETGREIHSKVQGSGMEMLPLVGNSLIYMYAKCGCLKCGREVFEKMCERDVLSWYAMIAGYKQHGFPHEAIQLYEQMEKEKIKPNSRIWTSVLNACADLVCLQAGRRVHDHILKHGEQTSLSVSNALVDMYAKCGDIENARRIFDEMSARDVVSWSAIIGGYIVHGFPKEALKLYEQMQVENFRPNEMTFASILKACGRLASLEQGKRVHAEMLNCGIELDVILRTALVDMYGKCGSIKNARKEFEAMPKRNVVSWNAMIAAYVHQGLTDEAVRLYYQMQREGLQPSSATIKILRNVDHTNVKRNM